MPYPKMDVSQGKRCPMCQEFKTPEHFSKTKGTTHGLAVYCKPCMSKKHNTWRRKNLARVAKQLRDRRKKDPQRFRDYHRKCVYKMPIGQYEAMLAMQGGVCAICGTDRPDKKPGRSFHIDHCHSSKEIRGLLCGNCNLGLGHFQDDVKLLQSAISYLSKRC